MFNMLLCLSISKHPKKESVPKLFPFLKHPDIIVVFAEQHEKSMFIPSFKLRSNKSSGKYVNIIYLDRWKLYFRLWQKHKCRNSLTLFIFLLIGKDHCHTISVVEHWGLAYRIPSSVRVYLGNHCSQSKLLLPCSISWETREREVFTAEISNLSTC